MKPRTKPKLESAFTKTTYPPRIHNFAHNQENMGKARAIAREALRQRVDRAMATLPDGWDRVLPDTLDLRALEGPQGDFSEQSADR